MTIDTPDNLLSTTVAAVIVDNGGEPVWVSRAFEQCTGYGPADLDGSPPWPFLSPADADRMASMIDRAFRGGPTEAIDTPVIRPDGTGKTVHWSTMIFHDPGDPEQTTVAVLGTEAGVPQPAIEHDTAAERYSTLFNDTGVAMAVVSEDTTFLTVNEEFEIMTGYPKVRAEGKMSWTELIAGEDDLKRLREYHWLRRINPALAPGAYEAEIRTAEGGLRYVAVRATMIPGTTQSHISLLDITGRKRAEDALRESEEKYRSLVENMQDSLYRCDVEGNITFVSPSAVRLLGYDGPGEMIGRSIADFAYDPGEMAPLLGLLKTEGRVSDREVTLRHRNGDPVIVSGSSQVLYGRDGSVAGTEGIFRDITARKRAEAIAEASRKTMDGIFQTAVDFSFIAVDQDGTIAAFSRGGERMLGYAAEEIVGRETPLIFHLPAEIAVRSRELSGELGHHVADLRVFSAKPDLGEPETREWTYVRKDGSTFPVSLTVTSVRSDQGEITGYLGIAHDITKRKQAVDEANKLAAIVRKSNELVNLFTPDGRMIFLNEAGAQMLGIAPHEVEGTNIMDVIPDHLKPRIMNELFPALRAGGTWEGDLQYIHLKTGRTMDVHTLAFSIDAGDDPDRRHLVNISLDISQQRQTEDKFTKVFMMAPDGITITRMSDGLIIDANLGFTGISGWDRSEAIGKTVLDLRLWADPADRERLVAELKRGRDILHYDFRLRRKDGTMRSGLFSARLIQLAGEAYLLGVMQDVTERRETEKRLRENEERLRAITANIPGAVYRLYATDGGEYRLSYASERMADLFGVSADDTDALFPAFLSHIHEEDRERLLASLGQAAAQAAPWNFEGRFVRPQGELLWFQTMSTPARHGNRLVFDGILLDITKRKQAEEMSRQSKEKFSKIFMMAPDGIAITRLSDGLIVDRNIGFGDITGWEQDTIVGQTSRAVNFWVDYAERERIVAELEAGRDVLQREIQFRRKDGTVRNGICSARLSEIAGEPHIIFMLKDITERLETERQLWENEERIRSITANMPGAVYRLYATDSGEYGLSYASERMTDLFGVSTDDTDALFPAFLSHIHEEDRERFLASLGQAVAQAAPWNFEGRFVKSSGELLWFQIMSTPARHGDRLVFDGIMLNVTQRKQAEEMSRQSEEKFSKVFMMAPDFMSISRLEDGLIMDVNLGFEDITGWKRTEVIGRTSLDLNFWIDPAERAQLVVELKAGRDVLHREFRFRRKDGTERNGTYSARISEIADVQYLLFVMQDTTERRQLEEDRLKLEQQLFQAQKMEAIGTLAGGIAHDFNNILAGIIGYTELSQDAVRDLPRVHRSMEQVIHAAHRAKELVKQILTFSRKAEQEKKPFLISPMVKEVVKFMRASLPTTIEIRQTSDLPSEAIIGDPSQMHQVLMNLCTNAWHAMKDTGGILEIGIRESVVETEDFLHHPPLKVGRYLELYVRDTGHGISRENLGRIFDPYFTTKEKGEGTGLGLAVVHGIIKDHGGEIRVYSEEGQGTVFRIYLPLLEKLADAGPEAEETVLPGRGESILFIDDEEMVAELSRELLTGLGYRVTAETDPVRAVERFRDHSNDFDLVITDKTMPGMTGFDLTRKLREIRTDIPVLLCSGFQEKTDLDKIAALGIGQLLIKPVRIGELSRAVRAVLDREAPPAQRTA